MLTYQSHLNKQPKQIQDKYPFERSQPRTLLANLAANHTVPKNLKDKISRAEAASLNGYENLGFFASAVVAANLGLFAKGGRDGLWLTNVLSLGYCLSRAVFCIAYVNGVSGPHRGVYFYTGVGCCIHMFLMAGWAMTDMLTK
jgi:uncharacterized MAPEG superfamily protein